MKKKYESQYLEIEDEHPWFKARRKLFLSIIPKQTDLRILDYGCGSGRFLKELNQHGYNNLSGVEISRNEKIIANNSQLIPISSSLSDGEKYDLILMMDVLEHIADDLAFLKKIKSHLNIGGRLVLSVPAYQFLWSQHDINNQHYRRYCKGNLKKILKEADLQTNWISYWNCFFLPFIAINRLLKKNNENELLVKKSFLSIIMLKVLNFESYLLPKLGFPFGLSIVASCKNQ